VKRLVGAFIIIAFAVAAGRVAYLQAANLKWFKLADVEISCPEHLSEDQVLKASALRVGESIFRQNFELAGERLIALPGVEVIEVQRVLPSKVKIDVYPEKVVLLVKTHKLFGLTRGLKLIELKQMDQVLPVVTGLGNTHKSDYTDKIKLGYALSIYTRLNALSENLAGRLSEIHFTGDDNVDMYFDPGGVKVVVPLRDYQQALARMVIIDNKGLLGNSGSFDMTAGKMVVKDGV
jgi:cell division septal protein FtsQ